MIKQYKKGFSLLELVLVLGVGTAMAFIKFQDMKNEQEVAIANTVGAQIKQVGEAVNRYISIRYDKLSTLTSSTSQSNDPGPRVCSSNGCEITYQTLINEGLLPVSYTGMNANKSSYKVLLKRSGIAPNYVIDGLVMTTAIWNEGGKVRYDLLGKAMQSAGIDSGMTRSPTVASGYGGQWNEKSSDYSNITTEGLLAYRVGYDSSMYSAYLRRDGTLPMTGALNMGGKSINNAKDITAADTVMAEILKSTGSTNVGGALTVVGNSALTGPVEVRSTLSVSGASTYGGVVQVNNVINATGNITSFGQVKGEIVVSTGRMTTGEFLQINGTATVGVACYPNGLLGRSSVGTILMCKNGMWRNSATINIPPQQISCRSQHAWHYGSIDAAGTVFTRTIRDGYGDTGWVKGSSFVSYGETNVLLSGIRGRSLLKDNPGEYLCMSQWIND
ncbi:shufflon system plasmid conjugative transfer pilus tip adhesin PilV [Yersinia intermedia]|uniref:shufflon system plasmid conjugative transfer pilus tip adhesin PilV n=1 Tax=Yersinia intermedia TaxID=631 RepID=UPI00065D7DDD|nr:shufflon system plasmid conjugative transfer pilus tip adhesin PilV [Yersinia intermedia]CRY75393.1 Large exoprotein involved in heme utilization or adhesion [Yersinia intermedia]